MVNNKEYMIPRQWLSEEIEKLNKSDFSLFKRVYRINESERSIDRIVKGFDDSELHRVRAFVKCLLDNGREINY